jgi:hypothetical protein
MVLTCFLVAFGAMGCSQATGVYYRPAEALPKNQALVYLYFPDVSGTLHWDTVSANGRPIVYLEDGGYYPLLISHGITTFSVDRWRVEATIALNNAEAYYLKLEVIDRLPPHISRYNKGRRLSIVGKSVAEQEMRELRLMKACSISDGCEADQ